MLIVNEDCMYKYVLPLLACLSGVSCTTLTASNRDTPAENQSVASFMDANNVTWEQLNPARGKQSPRAATLWGSRTGVGPGGFLLKPTNGFRSPPHIHNIAYRGVVISGLLHNDDPNAANMWMPTGSFWTQPAGEIHVTAAQGHDALAYIEVEDNFGVLPATKAFESGEEALNVHDENVVWLDANTINWSSVEATNDTSGIDVAFLWGSQEVGRLRGTLLRLPENFNGYIKSDSDEFRAVVISGNTQINTSQSLTWLGAGSYFSLNRDNSTLLNCVNKACLLYLRTTGVFKIDAL